MSVTIKKSQVNELTAKRVVLAGNPNAGKTTLFNSLTKSSLRTGNFHGVTTSASEKTAGGITYVDAPGLYALSSYSMEENARRRKIKNADLIINVLDSFDARKQLKPYEKADIYG